MYIYIYRQTDRQTEKETQRQTDTQTDTQTGFIHIIANQQNPCNKLPSLMPPEWFTLKLTQYGAVLVHDVGVMWMYCHISLV